MEPTIVLQMISEPNEAAQRTEPPGSDFFPQFLPSTFENRQSKILQLLRQAAGLVMSIFRFALSRESADRLEAKIDRLLSEDGIDPGQFDYREEAGVQVKA